LDSGRYDFNTNDRFLQIFELTFDLSVFSFLVPLSVGATVYFLPHKGIAYLEVADTLETNGPTEATIFCLRYEWQRGEAPHPQGKESFRSANLWRVWMPLSLKENSLDEEGELCLTGDQVTLATGTAL